MKIWVKAVNIFNFHAQDINKSLRHIVVPYNIYNFEKKITQVIKERGLGQ